MSDIIHLYDETETTKTRYIGFVGKSSRYDLMITTTDHFYGKKVVTCLQTNRTAILNEEDASTISYLADAFALSSEEAEELSQILLENFLI